MIAQVSITEADVRWFRDHGYLVIPGFYDVERDIDPIKDDIRRLFQLVCEGHGITLPPGAGDDFDAPLSYLLQGQRKLAAMVYDAVKKLPSYVRLACDRRHEDVVAQLLDSPFIGFANHGFGMRMDNPNEDRFLTQLHQDYASQLCSARGVVTWSPLRPMTDELGPVEFFDGSHRAGILPMIRRGSASRDFVLADEEAILRTYPIVRPLPGIGDIVIADFLTVHRSSPNRSEKTRWAMLSRYFDFLHASGRSYGWHGGLQEGHTFDEVHPDLCTTE